MNNLTHFAGLSESEIKAHCAAVVADEVAETEAASLAFDLAAVAHHVVGQPFQPVARFEFVSDFIPVADVVPVIMADDSCFDELPDTFPVAMTHEQFQELDRPFRTPFGDCRLYGFDKPAADLTAEELATCELRELQTRYPKTWESQLLTESRRVAKNAEFEAARDGVTALAIAEKRWDSIRENSNAKWRDVKAAARSFVFAGGEFCSDGLADFTSGDFEGAPDESESYFFNLIEKWESERDGKAGEITRPDFTTPREYRPNFAPSAAPLPVADPEKINPAGYVPLNSARSLTSAQKTARALNSRPKSKPAKVATAAKVTAAAAVPGDLEPVARGAVERVAAYVGELKARHIERAAKLQKSFDWQVSQIEAVIEFHAAKGRDVLAALELWERGAVAAADKKVAA